jgi:hypothetical protein
MKFKQLIKKISEIFRSKKNEEIIKPKLEKDPYKKGSFYFFGKQK